MATNLLPNLTGLLPQIPDPLASLPITLPRIAPRRSAAETPMTEEEENQLLSVGLGGLEFLGNTFDLPGAVVRGTLLGLTEGDWSRFPGSEQGRIYGRDLLTRWGMAPNKEGIGAWVDDPAEFGRDMAGFALEVGLDPLNAITIAPKTLGTGAKAAQASVDAVNAAVKAGNMDDAVRLAGQHVEDALRTGRKTHTAETPLGWAEEIRSGERGVLGLGAPWPLNWLTGNQPLVTFGQGSDTAAKAVEAIGYGKASPVRPLRQMFGHNIDGVLEGRAQMAKDAQYELRRNYVGAMQEVSTVWRNRATQLSQMFDDLKQHAQNIGDVNMQSWDNFSRMAAEQFQGDTAAIANLFNQGAGAADPAKVREFAAGYNALFDSLVALKNKVYNHAVDLGLNGKQLADQYVGHFPRYSDLARRHKEWGRWERERLIDANFKSTKHRDDVLSNIPGGAVTHNTAAKNVLIGAAKMVTREIPDPNNPGQMISRRFLARAEAKGVVPAGTIVSKTENGTTLYGRVVGADKSTAFVHFENPGGMDFTEQLAPARFTVVPNAAQLPPGVTVPDAILDEVDLEREIRRWFAHNRPGMNVSGITKLDDLRDEQIYQQYLKPAHDEMVQRGIVTADQWDELRLRHGWKKGDTYTEWDAAANNGAGAWVTKQREKTVPSAATELRKYMERLPMQALETGVFDRNWIHDYSDYMEHLLDVTSNLQTMHNFIGKVVGTDPDNMPLKTIWMGLSRNTSGGKVRLLNSRGYRKFLMDNAPRLGFNVPMTDPQYMKKLLKFGDSLTVPEETANAMRAYTKVAGPEAEYWMKTAFDKYTSVWKAWHTIMFRPSFFTRNQTNATWTTFVEAQDGSFKLTDAAKHLGEVSAYMAGKTDTFKYKDVSESLGLGIGGRTGLADTFVDTALAEIPGGVPEKGAFFKSFTSWYTDPKQKVSGWKAVSPLNLRGMAEPGAPQSIAAQIGENWFKTTEFLARYPMFAALLDAGYTPAQALARTERAFFDYSKLSQFEKRVMRRWIPFYGFLRNNIAYQFSNLFQRPGGRTAQTLRAMAAARRESEGGYVPAFIKEKAGISLGGPSEATEYVRSLGIGIEDLGQYVVTGINPAQRNLERIVAGAHPLISNTYEIMSGREPFSGRDVKYAYDRPFSLPAANQALDYLTPFSGVTNTYAQLFDEKASNAGKLLDYFTGVKVDNYDVEKLKLIELQNRLDQYLASRPEVKTFTRPYVPKELQGQVPPEVMRSVKLQATIDKRIRELKRQRLAEQAKAG